VIYISSDAHASRSWPMDKEGGKCA